jgi:hypothetical protein
MCRVRYTRLILAILVGCLLPANGCGKKNPIDGTYHDSSGLMTFNFHSGDCDVTVAGITRHYTYAISGSTVTITPEKGRNGMTFQIQSNGSLRENSTGDALVKATK